MSILGDQIKKLKSEGKSYLDISKELGCSKSTVSYHCGEGQKEKTLKRTRKRRLKGSVRITEYQRYKNKNLAYSQNQRTIISDNYAKELITNNKVKVSIKQKKIDIMTLRINKVLKRIK